MTRHATSSLRPSPAPGEKEALPLPPGGQRSRRGAGPFRESDATPKPESRREGRANHRDACRVLARLLAYPDNEMLALLPAIGDWIDRAEQLSPHARTGLTILVASLMAQADALESQAAYVDCFDRGRRTSLHLFEHVHGDSRDRGPALVSLAQTYADAGLVLAPGELPDYLPVVLEFASTQPADVAREFLAEMGHILNALHSALAHKGSPYAAVIAAVLELAGEPVAAVPVDDEEPLDQAWAEPEAFGGCSSAGQQRPGQAQPVRIVRRPQGNGNEGPLPSVLDPLGGRARLAEPSDHSETGAAA